MMQAMNIPSHRIGTMVDLKMPAASRSNGSSLGSREVFCPQSRMPAKNTAKQKAMRECQRCEFMVCNQFQVVPAQFARIALQAFFLCG